MLMQTLGYEIDFATGSNAGRMGGKMMAVTGGMRYTLCEVLKKYCFT